MENQQEVCLLVDDKEFKAKKDQLIEYSDYFSAMFGGNFIEKEQQKIRIDVVDSGSMEIILRYMELGFIDLSDYSLATVGDLFLAAIFLQIMELCKQIDYCLAEMLSVNNWIEILEIAQKAPSPKLEQKAVTYGLLSFKNMKPEYIPTVHKLYWYLSHPYLYADSELQVFTFGVQWCELNNMNAQGLLIILCCLDYSKLQHNDLIEMKNNTMMKDEDFIFDVASSPVQAVINGLFHISKVTDLSITSLEENKELLYKDDENLGEDHYTLVVNIIRESIQRKLKLTPAVPMWTYEDSLHGMAELTPNFLYAYSHETGLNKWLEISEKGYWGWSLTTWTPTKIVMCGGEYGRGTGKFMRDVRVYDIHKKEWIHHGVQLPKRRHAGVVVLGDDLYIIGGVGGYRLVLDSAIIYNLKERTYRQIAKLPDAMQSTAVCVHENEVYMAAYRHIYKYVGTGDGVISDRWEQVIETDSYPNLIIPLNGYIYVAYYYSNFLFSFRPGKDLQLKEIANFEFPPTIISVMDSKILIFTLLSVDLDDENTKLDVEEFCVTIGSRYMSRRPCWSQHFKRCGVHLTGSCEVLMDPPPINPSGISEFHQEILKANAEDFPYPKRR